MVKPMGSHKLANALKIMNLTLFSYKNLFLFLLPLLGKAVLVLNQKPCHEDVFCT
jgi:hypothetical protein